MHTGSAAVLNELAWLHFDAHAARWPPSTALRRAWRWCARLADPGWLGGAAQLDGDGARLSRPPRRTACAPISPRQSTCHRAANDANGRAHALLQLSVVDGLEGRYAEARQLAEER